MKPVYVPRDLKEKQMQRALIQYRNPENYETVKRALKKAGRGDLIGFGAQCLIPPRKIHDYKKAGSSAGSQNSREKKRTPAGSQDRRGGCQSAARKDRKPAKRSPIRTKHHKKS